MLTLLLDGLRASILGNIMLPISNGCWYLWSRVSVLYGEADFIDQQPQRPRS